MWDLKKVINIYFLAFLYHNFQHNDYAEGKAEDLTFQYIKCTYISLVVVNLFTFEIWNKKSYFFIRSLNLSAISKLSSYALEKSRSWAQEE